MKPAYDLRTALPRPLVDDEKVGDALRYLADTDGECAQLKAEVQRTEYVAKLRESKVFLTSEGNVEQRKSTAKVAKEVQEAWETHFKAIGAYESVKARRERAVLTVDLWRTLAANRRAGNVQ